MDKFLHVVYVFICFACQWMSQLSSIFDRDYTAFKVETPLESCVLCIICFLKAILNFLVLFFLHFSPFESKLYKDALKKNTIYECFSLVIHK